MTILKDVLGELFAMFVADVRITTAILAIIAVTAILMDLAGVSALVAGGFLLAGCLLTVIVGVLGAAR
ncbi:MAG: hypothetical protein LJE67_13765 [Salaquimonas sp.]|jgi:hypothetical protein|nr:hypothetical protein [Salaquimonas sp.]